MCSLLTVFIGGGGCTEELGWSIEDVDDEVGTEDKVKSDAGGCAVGMVVIVVVCGAGGGDVIDGWE